MHGFNKIAVLLAAGFMVMLAGCEDAPSSKAAPGPAVVQKKIKPQAAAPKPAPEQLPEKPSAAGGKDKPAQTVAPALPTLSPAPDAKPGTAAGVTAPDPDALKAKTLAELGLKDVTRTEHYNAQGKIDPFKPLIQDKSEEQPLAATQNRPERILTPLEKIDLSQIRLVAVIIIPEKKIQMAMVEEASGKGYEVGIGTYIGKNQGRITQIKSSSIVIKELVTDYKGRLRERTQEIKLNKSDEE